MKINNHHYYVQRPSDSNWKTALSNWVVEAVELDINDKSLQDWQKTKEFVNKYLKVETFEYGERFIVKDDWIECKTPVKEGALTQSAYFELIRKELPNLSLPQTKNFVKK